MSCVPFPKAKKRGAKVRRGPAAQVLAFPAQLSGDDLRARWAWLFRHAGDWQHEDIEGTYTDPNEWEVAVRITGAFMAKSAGEEQIDRFLRRDIDRMCRQIERRTQVKNWLETLGIDWKEQRSPEDALLFLYDRLNAPNLPLSA